MAYLNRQYKVVTLVFIILVVILALLAKAGIQNPFVPIAFLTGGFFSGLCGYIGMRTATNASARTAQGCSEGLNRGLQVAFRSGAVMGLVVVGFGLLDICLWYWVLDAFVYTPEHMANGWTVWGLQLVPAGTTDIDKLVQITTTMITFGMGASTQALFARVGGGIYTKAADVGADLVGKVEAEHPRRRSPQPRHHRRQRRRQRRRRRRHGRRLVRIVLRFDPGDGGARRCGRRHHMADGGADQAKRSIW